MLTGDAVVFQHALCQQGFNAGGDSLLLAAADQETLHHDFGLLCDPPPTMAALPLIDRRVTRTVECGHGRGREARPLIASTDLNGCLDWPPGQHVLRRERT